jgi:hypothetical protein
VCVCVCVCVLGEGVCVCVCVAKAGKIKTIVESLGDLRMGTGAHRAETFKAFLRSSSLKPPS